MAANKRKAEEPLSEGHPSTRPRLSATSSLPYPDLSRAPVSVPAVQQPDSLLTFSYDADRVQKFDDSALRYYVEPPRGADLGFNYGTWVKRPEERGRLDGLLAAWSRWRSQHASAVLDIHVMSWRGVMTK